ncbi:MAG: hypothetical protein WBQ02_16780, partial [Terracidiphilus sp.]
THSSGVRLFLSGHLLDTRFQSRWELRTLTVPHPFGSFTAERVGDHNGKQKGAALCGLPFLLL